MTEIKTTVIEQPAKISKAKAEQLGRIISALLSHPEFRAKVEAYLAAEGGECCERV